MLFMLVVGDVLGLCCEYLGDVVDGYCGVGLLGC